MSLFVNKIKVKAAHFLRVKWSTFLGCRSATAVILNYGLNFWLAQDWQKCKHWFQWQSIASLLVLCHCVNANATPLPLEIWISLWITWILFILWFFMTSKICLIIVHGFMNAAIKNYGYDQWSLTINVHSYIYEHRSCMINDHRYIAMNIDRQWSLIMSIITHDQWSLPWNAVDHTWSVLINGLYREPYPILMTAHFLGSSVKLTLLVAAQNLGILNPILYLYYCSLLMMMMMMMIIMFG